METLTKGLIQELLTANQEPCISLYMPTHRTYPGNAQDLIRFKNLVKQIEASLLLNYSPAEAKKHLEPFESLGNDTDFWNHTSEGLAVFNSPGFFKAVGMQRPVDEMVMVADSFHTKPLRQYLQSVDHYYLLALSLHDFRLFEGNHHSLVEVDLADDSPKTIEDALGDELTEKHSTVASYGGTGGESSTMHHGHGGRKDESDIDAERYFRVVATYINDKYSKPTGWPLLLAALPEHHNLFRKVSKNPLLMLKSVAINPAAVSPDKLATMAWEIMEPEYLLKLGRMAEQYAQAKADGKGSDDYKEVAVAAVEGRIDTLLIEADRMIAVRITNLVTGNTQNKDLQNPKVDDLLDDMGELVEKMGGQVMVLPADKMPADTGLAAIFRY
jgi:hypothetical protein